MPAKKGFQPCSVKRELNASSESIDPGQPEQSVEADLCGNFLQSADFLYVH